MQKGIAFMPIYLHCLCKCIPHNRAFHGECYADKKMYKNKMYHRE